MTMDKSNQKKKDQLGMPIGTASGKLRKNILFYLLQQTDLDICFQCGEKIENVEELSIEHKIPWLDSEDPINLFFDLDNIAFSHLKCNIGAARNWQERIQYKHGTTTMYNKYGCRCKKCKAAHTEYRRKQRNGIVPQVA